jgi:hypothetical protein
MATNRTVTKKLTIKKEDKDGIDINQVLSQSSKKGKVSIGKHETIVQRAETTPFDFEDAPIGTYEVRMHSTKKSKKKTKKKEKLEPTVPELPAPRYDRAFLAKIFNKNRETNTSQGATSLRKVVGFTRRDVPEFYVHASTFNCHTCFACKTLIFHLTGLRQIIAESVLQTLD